MTADQDSPSTRALAQRDAHLVRLQHKVSDYAIRKAVGAELRHVREAGGWSRAEFVARLPSGIGDRTLLSYEHGSRHMTVSRLIEVSRALGRDAPSLLSRALQQAHIYLDTLPLRIDLRTLGDDTSMTFRLMRQWARNKLNECPDGVAEILPGTVREMAMLLGCLHLDLATYLALFIPDETTGTEPDVEDVSDVDAAPD